MESQYLFEAKPTHAAPAISGPQEDHVTSKYGCDLIPRDARVPIYADPVAIVVVDVDVPRNDPGGDCFQDNTRTKVSCRVAPDALINTGDHAADEACLIQDLEYIARLEQF